MGGGLRPALGRVTRRVAKLGFTLADVPLGRYPGPRILIYHQVGLTLGRQMEVTLENFQAQLMWLRQHMSVAPLEVAVARRGEPGANSLVVLSFDDGYADLYLSGFPVLRELGLPFALYITTNPVETRVGLGSTQAAPLTWDQIGDMASSGLMTLGVHTHTHPDLRLLEASVIALELGASDELIKRRLGVRPRHFAYPWGYWSGQADPLVRQRYETAVLGGGSAINAETDPFLLHRLPIQLSDGLFFFRRKLHGGLRLEESARRWVSGYRGP